jgi:hypothetical protein
LIVACALALCAGPAVAFDRTPWLEDLAQVRQALATKYANLEWVVFDHETDLQKLFAETETRIEKAGNDSDARAAFDRLADKLGDEHVGFKWRQETAGAANVQADRCATLGYDEHSRAKPLAANADGYQPLETSASDEFPAGLITTGGRKIGVLKIGVFMPQGYPALCRAVVADLGIPKDARCNDACEDRIDSVVANRQTRDLIALLHHLEAAGAQALVVDIAGNGGGTEWAEAVARMLTRVRLNSEQIRFVRGAHWEKTFAGDELELREFAGHAQPRDHDMLLQLANEVGARRQQALTPCDSAPLWQGRHPRCEWLGRGFYGSGLLATADPNELHGKPWAELLFTPMQYPYEEGVWRGPLIVLIDRDVASAASEFAAVLQDNRAAIVMGEPSGGGCGHTNGGTPTTLARSKATFAVPDCARYRADGTNEARGIEPDVLVGFTPADGPHLRAAQFLAKLPEALARAESLPAKR